MTKLEVWKRKMAKQTKARAVKVDLSKFLDRSYLKQGSED